MVLRQRLMEQMESRMQVEDEELRDLIDMAILEAAEGAYLPLKERLCLRKELFAPQPLIYKVKREQSASKKQKEVLRELLKYHRINLSAQIDSLSKNEISRLTDQIIAQHGRMQKR